MSKKEDGATLFEKMYEGLYGSRWPELKRALLKESTPIPFYMASNTPYYMDEASIIAAQILPLKHGDIVLDMCSAPGGKALVLASRLKEDSSLICNDRSSSRRNRLHHVLDTHLEKNVRERISITSHDASKWALYEKDRYDAILLDAPCSSERHVVNNPLLLRQWSNTRPKRLAIQQFAMLCSALEAVKVGGYILYSTCSIQTIENEGVIDKLAKKRKGRYSIEPLPDVIGEEVSYGKIILPDTQNNLGPLYICLIRRVG